MDVWHSCHQICFQSVAQQSHAGLDGRATAISEQSSSAYEFTCSGSLKMCVCQLSLGFDPQNRGILESICAKIWEYYSPNLRTLFPNCGRELTLGFNPQNQGIFVEILGTNLRILLSKHAFVSSLWPITNRFKVFWREFVHKFENILPKTCLWAHFGLWPTELRYFGESLCPPKKCRELRKKNWKNHSSNF